MRTNWNSFINFIFFNWYVSSTRLNNFIYLSFMHRDQPESYPGLIYKLEDDTFFLQEKSVFIPNTFIDLKDFFLISDSFKNTIWSFEHNDVSNLVNKRLWAKIFRNSKKQKYHYFNCWTCYKRGNYCWTQNARAHG